MEKKITTIKQRVLQLLKNKNVAVSTFFPSIGESYANFKGTKLQSSLSSDTLATIVSNFPDVNLEWLIMGNGDMFKTKQNTASSSALLEILKEKDARIEKYIRENERLTVRLNQLETKLQNTTATSLNVGQSKGA